MLRLWRRAPRGARREEDLLVISDVHLGEDILHEGPARLAEYIRAHNRELSGFVEYHRRSARRGARWHLVINGDFFDFLKVTALPEGAPPKLSPKERARALTNTPTNVLWKLSCVLAAHRPFFRELARFLIAGHRLTFLEGNHDAEVYFPEVRAALRRALLELAAEVHIGDGAPGRFVPERLSAAVAFRTWFLARPGRYHIEHGHLYDPYSSVAFHLAPREPKNPGILATPLSHKTLPYVADLLGDFSTHGVSERGLWGFVRLLWSRGRGTLWTTAKLYAGFGAALVATTGRRRRRALAAFEAEHQAQLLAMAKDAVYEPETLSALDGLRAPPAEFSLVRMARRFYFDRVALAAGVGASLLLGTRGSLSALACGLGLYLTRRGPAHDLDALLEDAAARIGGLTRAPLVVFGHSHRPVMLERDGTLYVNSGCWVTREIVRGESCEGMTYVELTAQGVALKRWRGAGSPPAVLGAKRLGKGD
jgi:UDP-2,3-diacylglucosamine pyrophosphatase LpxH